MNSTQQQHQYLATSDFAEIMDGISDAVDLNALGQHIVARLNAFAELAGCGIWVRIDEQIICIAHKGLDAYLPRGWLELPLTRHNPIEQAMHLGVSQTTNLDIVSNGHQALAPQSFLLLPLKTQGRCVGALLCIALHNTELLHDKQAALRAIASHLAAIIRNIQLSQQLDRHGRQLATLEHQRDEFLSVVLHDLKNPITSIKGYAELMLRRITKVPNDPNRKGLEIIAQQVGRVTWLLEQLLDLSRAGMNRLQIERQWVDLGALLRSIVEEHRLEAPQHTINLVIEHEPLTGLFDETRIGRVLGCLLSNAIKFSPEGGAIDVRLWRENGMYGPEARFSISDSGIGIPVEEQGQLFQRFFRASNADKVAVGMGLSLFLAREIVNQHSGRIWLESIEGSGTTAHVMLPLEYS